MAVAGLLEVPTRKEGTFLERAMRRIAPGYVARRERALTEIRQHEVRRKAIDELERAFKGYAGASRARGQTTWNPGGGSPDEDILEGLPDLRERSRDLIRNDPHAAGMVDTWVNNVVGHGMTPQSRLDPEAVGLSPEAAADVQKAAEKAFSRWAQSADVSGLATFAELQELVLRQVFENGDVFTVPRSVEGRRYSLAVEVLEADRITTPPSKATDARIREGVQIGAQGEPLGYWVKRTHPGDTTVKQRTDDFVFVPLFDSATGRRNIYHLFRSLRPGQSRGVPHLAPALPMFRDLQQYIKAELIGAKVAACYALFITTPDPYGDAARATNQTVQGKQHELLEPGMIRRLAPGEDVKGFEPNRPANNFDVFVKRILRAIGTGEGMPYELVSMDFTETTYTSGRMALTEVRRTFKKYQRWLAQKFCQPIWERVLLEAFLMGELRAPRFLELFEEYTRCLWVGPGWSWVDPQKEVAATVEAIEQNLTTLADECAARGQDWEDTLSQRAREKDLTKKLGLEPEPQPVTAGVIPGKTNDGDQEDDEED